MRIYGFKTIKVKIWKKGFTAAALTLIKDRIYISKDMIESLNENEIEAVIAHEFSHLHHRDTLLILPIMLIFSAPFFLFSLQSYFHPVSNTDAILIIFSLFVFSYGIKIVNWIKQNQEILADRDAAIKIKNPLYLESALIKIYNHPPVNGERASRLSKIFQGFEYLKAYFLGFTHPFLKERIEHIEFANRILDNLQKTTVEKD